MSYYGSSQGPQFGTCMGCSHEYVHTMYMYLMQAFHLLLLVFQLCLIKQPNNLHNGQKNTQKSNECTKVQNPQHMHHRWRMHLSVEGKTAASVVAAQCRKDSGSAMEHFQRKSHKSFTLILCIREVVHVVCTCI